MNVVITRTTALYPRAVFVQWDVDSAESGTFYVDIARSGSPEGPWDLVATALPNIYHYIDDNLNMPHPATDEEVNTSINFFSLAEDLYYQVTVTPPSGPANAVKSAPTPVEPGLDKRTRLLKRKILRDASIAFRKLNGIELIILKRKHWGARCPNCWDAASNQGTIEHCATCFGTTFEGGYWAPVLIRGLKAPVPIQTQMTVEGLAQTKITTFKILDYPLLEAQDLVVDLRRDDRYIISSVEPRELRGIVVHQTLTSSLIARDAVEYTLNIPLTSTPGLY